MRLATSSCNPACQEHRSITHALLRAAVPMSQPVANPSRKSGAVRNMMVIGDLYLKSNSGVWCAFCAHDLPKVTRACSEAIFDQTHLSLQSHVFFVDIEPRTRGNRDRTSATPGATLPDRLHGFAPQTVFTREFTCSGSSPSSKLSANIHSFTLLSSIIFMIVSVERKEDHRWYHLFIIDYCKYLLELYYRKYVFLFN
jgi:hypothetical protein